MAKKAAEKALNIDNILFNCRDILRVARNSGSFFEKRDMMLTLVFLRFIGEKYEDGIQKLREILIQQGLDPDDENIIAGTCDYGGDVVASLSQNNLFSTQFHPEKSGISGLKILKNFTKLEI